MYRTLRLPPDIPGCATWMSFMATFYMPSSCSFLWGALCSVYKQIKGQSYSPVILCSIHVLGFQCYSSFPPPVLCQTEGLPRQLLQPSARNLLSHLLQSVTAWSGVHTLQPGSSQCCRPVPPVVPVLDAVHAWHASSRNLQCLARTGKQQVLAQSVTIPHLTLAGHSVMTVDP